MTSKITNSEDVIDSRDIIARIEELEALSEEPEWTVDDFDELEGLQAFATNAKDYAPDWEYGATLIRESYFTDYIEELIKDCYELPKELATGAWPYRHIKVDYEAAAQEAKVDYTEVEFDGVTYLVR